MFLKYLIDVAEATGISHAPYLDEALQYWRLALIANFGFHLQKSWTALQRQNVITFAEEACDRLANRDSIPMEEIVGWPFTDGNRLFHRGLKEVHTAPVIELGVAIIALLRDELPKAPKGEAWFFTDAGRSTIRMEPSREGNRSILQQMQGKTRTMRPLVNRSAGVRSLLRVLTSTKDALPFPDGA